ncbi:MAG: hypothetical protein KatS3mg062_1216 [Tepidiforma sp.]|nr:MAG: hypothetical protein KatS3mg062_1216 [Tepidiforma sp.]
MAAFSASAASNTVPPTNIDQDNVSLTISQLAPPECAGMPLNEIEYDGNGGGGNDLVLGGPGSPATLRGGGGNDCIVGGAGNTVLRGEGGNDVLVGGPVWLVVLNGGGGNDTCHRGSAFWVWLIDCEAYVP